MRKLLVGGVAFLALTAHGTATAADLPRVPPKVSGPVVAPLPVAYNWSGFYFGGHVGWGKADTEIIEADAVNLALGFPATQSVKSDGFLGGLQAGWNYQVGNFVAGIEGDVSFTAIKGSSSTTVDIGGDPYTFKRSVDVDWIATATGRLGYAMDRWLVYGKGGAAFARFKYKDDIYQDTDVFGAGSGDKTRVGWTVGAGLEYAFLNQWSAKLEYNYMDFGKRSVNFSDSVLGSDYSMDVEQRIHAVKAGVNYRY